MIDRMTTPRDDIAGLSERLRKRSAPSEYSTGDVLGEEAATQLDSLLKERDALQARVKELEERVHYAEGTADLAMKHRDSAEQERDEAYERAAGILRERMGEQKALLARLTEPETRSAVQGSLDQLLICLVDIRRLAAGPEKEKTSASD